MERITLTVNQRLSNSISERRIKGIISGFAYKAVQIVGEMRLIQ